MKEKFKKKFTKKRIIIFSIILIILVMIIRGNIKSKQIMYEANKPQIDEITKRKIAKSVSTTGKITTETSKNITSTLTGSKILTVKVEEGQKINEGDTICTFDISKIKSNFSDAKTTANISDEQMNMSIESARRALNDASSERDSAIIKAQQDVAKSQQEYDTAQNALNTANTTIASKQAELDTLNIQYADAKTNFSSITADAANYTELQNDITTMENKIATLKAEIAALQAELPDLQNAANGLKAVFDKSVAILDQTSKAQDSQLAALQDNLRNAELAAKSANISQNSQLNEYKEQVDKGIVTSTVSGTITSVNVKPGDIYTGTTIATISDIDKFIVEAEIDEYDIPDIKEGMKALVKTDATKDIELEGIVSYVAISPSNTESVNGITSSNSNVTYKIQITLNEQNERLRLGMNAKISIILDSKEDVWTVPFDAIHERENGTKYIEIARNENPEETEELDVTVGIEGNYYVEIISDKLHEGMNVVIPVQDNIGTSIEELIMNGGADTGI